MKDKLNKIINYIKNDIKYNYKGYIIFILIVPWFFIKFDYYVYAPGGLISLDDRILISDSYEEEGSFNLTYVSAKNGTVPILLLSYIIPSWDKVSIDNSRIEDESSEDVVLRNQIYLKETSYDAVIASFTEANLPYEVTNIDPTVTYVYDNAETNLKLGDIIKSINGEKVTDFNSITSIVNSYEKGDKITITVKRDNKIIECYSVLSIADNRVIIGVHISEIKTVKTNPSVEYIFKDNESGSSRGLMCALEIYNRITKYDITKGDKISGTGTIDDNGNVGSIDGVKYKLSGAVKNKADVFIVPTDNYKEALELKEKNNYDIEIIEADNLHNVIEKLKNR